MSLFVDGALTAQRASSLRKVFKEMTPQKIENIREILMKVKENQELTKTQEEMIAKIRKDVMDKKIRDTYATPKKTAPLLPAPKSK